MNRSLTLRQRTSDHLNLIRGAAAFAVCVGHLRGLFFQDWKDVLHHSLATYLLYAGTGLGHQAVVVFFVLSGFFVGGAAMRTIREWSWKRYLGNRLTRLYLVLIPALVLTALLDQISMRMPMASFYFYQPVLHFNAEPLVQNISVSYFFGNLFFLQGILVRPFGSDGPLWSLSNEFWYYLLFPIILLVFFKTGNRARGLYSVLALALVIFFPAGCW